MISYQTLDVTNVHINFWKLTVDNVSSLRVMYIETDNLQ